MKKKLAWDIVGQEEIGWFPHEKLACLLGLNTILPISLFPLSPYLTRKFMSMIKPLH